MRRLARLAFVSITLAACGAPHPARGGTVLFASGADLQSIDPLLTVHPLARQVQRYVLLTTLVRYDSAMTMQPYLARRWRWDAGRRVLTFTLTADLRWHDGTPTTAADAAFTLQRGQDLATGYPRRNDLAEITSIDPVDDTTLRLAFDRPQPEVPDVLTDLAILPRRLLDTIPASRLRTAGWNERPVGNGPFRFVRHEPNRRWVFERNPAFPVELGGPPRLERLVIAVVDEPMTKIAALTAGELDFAGIQPAHAAFAARNPALAVVDYPLLFTVGLVFNTRRPPFAALDARRRVSAAIDRRALVDGVAFGFGTPADGPVPPSLPAYLPPPPARAPSGASAPLTFELLTVGSGEAALEQMLQAQLARQGITVQIRQLELATFLDRVYGPRHDFTAAIVGTPGDIGLGYLVPLLELTGLRPVAGAAPLQRLFQDSMPVAFLYHARGLQAMNRRVRGVAFGLRGELATVHDWSVAP